MRKSKELLNTSQFFIHTCNDATVKQTEEKFKNDSNEENDSVIIHLCTNDLVNAAMDDLLNEVKTHAKKIDVFSVIKRYDNKVHQNKIIKLNKTC